MRMRHVLFGVGVWCVFGTYEADLLRELLDIPLIIGGGGLIAEFFDGLAMKIAAVIRDEKVKNVVRRAEELDSA